MLLLTSLVFALLVFYFLSDFIKKHASIFYILTLLGIIGIIFYYTGKYYKVFPRWINHYIIGMFKRGAFATATFVIVMFLGVTDSNSKLIKPFRRIRGEMSIIASLSTFGHNLLYGVFWFPKALFHPADMKTQYLIATYLTMLMLILLIPLFITSFKVVRKKMNQKNWYKIQKLAYPFFLLIYVHVMVLFCNKKHISILNITVYSVIFGLYVILRLRKFLLDKKKKQIVKKPLINSNAN